MSIKADKKYLINGHMLKNLNLDQYKRNTVKNTVKIP